MKNNIETVEKANKYMRRMHKQIAALQETQASLCKVLCDGLEANADTLQIEASIVPTIIAPKDSPKGNV